jgi:UDP-N-acetylmuramate--alanine ligase
MSKKSIHTNKVNQVLSRDESFVWTFIYFIGIGGIGMSAIARYFLANDKKVGGYDKTPSNITKALEENGAEITFDDHLDSIPEYFLDKEIALIVYTPAIPKDHKQFNYFKNNNYTILKRAELLGEITKSTFCLAVAGTHGKTTTSSILGHILSEVKATSFLGGIAENYGSNLILGEDKVSVVEADEFDRSFLQLSPNIACITSMDADHLDIYGEAEALEESFGDFSEKVSDTLIVAKGLPIKGLTYAIEETADYKAFNLRITEGKYVFDVKTSTEIIENIVFYLPGKHNVMNALAATAMALNYGIPSSKIKEKLATFKGVERRFSYKIKAPDFVLIDDYAHHPTEINAVYHSAKEMYPNEKLLVIFQPHLFSRTQDFAEDFANALSQFDEVALLGIYPARELPIEGVTSEWLLDKIDNENKQIVTKENTTSVIDKTEAKIVLMLGAGDIGVLIQEVTRELKNKYLNEV